MRWQAATVTAAEPVAAAKWRHSGPPFVRFLEIIAEKSCGRRFECGQTAAAPLDGPHRWTSVVVRVATVLAATTQGSCAQ